MKEYKEFLKRIIARWHNIKSENFDIAYNNREHYIRVDIKDTDKNYPIQYIYFGDILEQQFIDKNN